MNFDHEQSIFAQALPFSQGFAYVVSRRELQNVCAWRQSFAGQLKDRRYYDLVDETLRGDFKTSYLILKDTAHQIRAIQPFFLRRQDLTEGLGRRTRTFIRWLRRRLPRFLTVRTLFVGCIAGSGHLSTGSGYGEAQWIAQALYEVLPMEAKKSKASLIVLKEFPAIYREPLSVLCCNGYTRVPSLPYVRLDLDFESFEEYMKKSLSRSRRKNFRRKFKKLESSPPVKMQVTNDLTDYVDEVYGLYLQVYERATMKFEKLTKEYLCCLGRYMPERARFFIWRQSGKAIAFSVCMVQGEIICDEYVGFDYPTALDLHLYFCTTRDILEWAIRNGYKTYYSTGCCYDPKLHFGCKLVPLDLYVRHTSSSINLFLGWPMSFLGPTRWDPVLKRFPNAHEL
jgi:hypothetical protein